MECDAPAGTGGGLAVVVDILGQKSEVSVATFDYHVPMLTRVSGTGVNEAATRGGQEIRLIGNFFGPGGNSDVGMELVYHYTTYKSVVIDMNTTIQKIDKINKFMATGCSWRSQTLIVCSSSEGYGVGMSYSVSVDGQASTLLPTNSSYAAPSIYSVTKLNGSPLHDANTKGGERVWIQGSNFGPATQGNVVIAQYKNDQNVSFTAVNCDIHESHSDIYCTSARHL